MKVLPSFTEQVWVVPNLNGAKQLEEEIVPSARRPRREREGGNGKGGRESANPRFLIIFRHELCAVRGRGRTVVLQ